VGENPHTQVPNAPFNLAGDGNFRAGKIDAVIEGSLRKVSKSKKKRSNDI
jgi:hypothetical protein